MRSVEELVDAEVSSIFEVDDASNELFFRVAQADETDKTKKVRMKMGEGVAGWVASSGEPLIVPDTQIDKRFSFKVDAITGFKTKSIIALPIKNRGRLIGVLEALNKQEDAGTAAAFGTPGRVRTTFPRSGTRGAQSYHEHWGFRPSHQEQTASG